MTETQTGPAVRVGDVGSAPTPQRRGWVGPALAVIAVVAVGVGTWVIMDSLTVPNDDYDEVQAQLEVTEAELQTSRASVAELRADSETATKEIAALGGERDAAAAAVAILEEEQAVLQDRIAASELGVEKAKTAVVAILFDELYLGTDWFRELEGAGLDPSVGDGLMEFTNARWATIEEYAGSYPIPSWGSAIEDAGDPVAVAAFEAWLDSPEGSLEETGAWLELRWHLFRVLVDILNEPPATASN